MARPKKYKIKLTDDELKELKSVIRKNKTSKTIRCRCQIIIDLDESHGKVLTHEQSAKSNGVCLATVTNTVKKYFEGGIDAVTEFKRNVNSDNARRVLDGRAEARIIELACGLGAGRTFKGGPSCFWKRRQKLFLILRSAVRQSEEP